MAVKESLYFSYDGVDSSDYGILNVTTSSGMYEEAFLAARSIREVKTKGSSKPYFQGVDDEPLTLKLEFAFEESWDEDKIREVARWLKTDYYKPLWFSENPDRIFYAILVDEAMLIHNGMRQGYVTLTMRCDSPYSYSPTFSKTYDFSNNPTSVVFDFINEGDAICKPEIWITKVGTGDISIVNTSDLNREFKFLQLIHNEVVYVDNEMEYIESSLPLTYRYKDFNNHYLYALLGKNKFSVTGACMLTLKFEFRTIQG